MSRARINVVGPPYGERFVLGIDEKKRIEAVYGRELSKEVWHDILEATSELTIFAPTVDNTAPVNVILEKLYKLGDLARSVRHDIVPQKQHWQATLTPTEIWYTFFHKRKRPPDLEEFFFFLLEILDPLIALSEFAAKPELDGQSVALPKGPDHRGYWECWVISLMKILKRNNLPHAARKDLDKKRPNAQSVFVLLVSELQKHFPAQIVRFANSEDALAQAIHRARDSYEAAIESKSKEVSVTLDRQIEKCAQAERAKLAKRADAHTWRRRDFMAALNATLNTRLSPVELAEVDKKMELCLSSNEAVDLVREGKLDAAEEAAKDLLIRFPDAHDGYDRLGMVYQARGERRQAAQCFRMAIEVIRRHPDDYGSSLEETFADLVDQLDQPAVT